MNTRTRTQLVALSGAGVMLAGVYVVGLNPVTATLAVLYAVAAAVAVARARHA